jgi:hypothetical protein
MRKHLFSLVLLSTAYFFTLGQTSPQIRTASLLNNLNNFQQVFGDQNYPMAKTAGLAAHRDMSDSILRNEPIMRVLGLVVGLFL